MKLVEAARQKKDPLGSEGERAGGGLGVRCYREPPPKERGM